MFRRLMPSRPKISFVCRPEDLGVITEPRPAKADMPAWFRKIPPVDLEHVRATDSGITVKRCMPFLDALTTGWILPLAATVRLEIKDGGKNVEYGWEFDRTMVSNHSPHQVAGHPNASKPPCKFHNYWSIRTPPGWSCLFMHPLNRPNGIFDTVAGIVDTDTYFAYINFPFFPIGLDGVHIIAKGTPIVQIFPFQRSSTDIESEVRAETGTEALQRDQIFRNTVAGAGWYREFARASRKQS